MCTLLLGVMRFISPWLMISNYYIDYKGWIAPFVLGEDFNIFVVEIDKWTFIFHVYIGSCDIYIMKMFKHLSLYVLSLSFHYSILHLLGKNG